MGARRRGDGTQEARETAPQGVVAGVRPALPNVGDDQPVQILGRGLAFGHGDGNTQDKQSFRRQGHEQAGDRHPAGCQICETRPDELPARQTFVLSEVRRLRHGDGHAYIVA